MRPRSVGAGKRVVALLAVVSVIVLGLATPAQAAVTEVGFTDYGSYNEGSFDLDLQVWNGLTGSSGWTYGVRSFTDWYPDTDGYFQVRTIFGAVQHSNTHTFSDLKEMNSPFTTTLPETDPNGEVDVRWAHEVASTSYDGRDAYEKWLSVWMTTPKLDPTDDHKFGENLSGYGWIGGKVFDNSGTTRPNADVTTVPAKEDRMICGNTCAWDAMDTDAYAENEPQQFSCPPTANSSCDPDEDHIYEVYAEPGIIDDGAGHTYMAVAGMHDAGDVSDADGDWRADILLFESEDNGQNWSFVGKLLDYTEAKKLSPTPTCSESNDSIPCWSYFTAPSIHVHGGDIWLDVSPADINYTAEDNPAPYQGMVELKITDLDDAIVETESCGTGCTRPKAYLSFADAGSPHEGAGGYYPPTATHQMSLLYVPPSGDFPYTEDMYRVYELGV